MSAYSGFKDSDFEVEDEYRSRRQKDHLQKCFTLLDFKFLKTWKVPYELKPQNNQAKNIRISAP